MLLTILMDIKLIFSKYLKLAFPAAVIFLTVGRALNSPGASINLIICPIPVSSIGSVFVVMLNEPFSALFFDDHEDPGLVREVQLLQESLNFRVWRCLL